MDGAKHAADTVGSIRGFGRLGVPVGQKAFREDCWTVRK
jgi:hypothetical protein